MSASSLPSDAFEPTDRAGWRAWLAANHASDSGVWLVMTRKAAPVQNLSLDDAVCEALCFGWIDSRPRTLDAERTQLYFAPRKAGSGWSAVNKARLAKLEAGGLIAAPGLARIQAAKQDGSWSKLDTVDALKVPADLQEAFGRYAGAEASFAAFPRSARRGILEWIAQAKTSGTRQGRLDETARLAAAGERANQWRGNRDGNRESKRGGS
jgi:uncharacterized protein YdeI (YjbR/CyaY-like superfamily)